MLTLSDVELTQCLVVLTFGLVAGFSVGFLFGGAYRSKLGCRECMRRIVKHGFSSDGKHYSAVKDGR